jgi:Na+/melibiose symporter-like transporter
MSTPAPASETPTTSGDSKKSKVWTVGTLSYTSGGIVVLFLWLLWGDFAWSMRDRSVGPMAQWYLKDIGVSNLLFGLLTSSFPALVGLILGPIISFKSDRHRGKRGRRLPFLLVTTPIAAFGMIGLAFTPIMAAWLHGLGQPGSEIGSWLHANLDGSAMGAAFLRMIENEVIVAVICFGVFWAAFEFATIAGAAVFGGLINDVVPKHLLGRFYGLFRAVSLIDGMIFNYWIMGKVPDHFTLILFIIALFYGIAFMWVCLKVKEGDYPPPPPRDPNAKGPLTSAFSGAKLYFRECFAKPYYLWVFLMLMFAGISFAPINIFAIPYAKSLNVNMDTYGKFLALTYLISLCLAYPLGWLADKFHPLRVSMAALVGYIAVSGWGMIFATDEKSFLTAWVLHGVLSGTYFTSAASLGQRLFPHDRFAQFASAAGILAAPANMALAPVVGTVIDVSEGVYRYTFTSGCILAVIALWSAWHVHGKFMKLGGTKNYQAPE